jgi:hypothetical protein
MDHEHVEALRDRNGYFYCLDILRFNGRIFRINGYSCCGPRWTCDEDLIHNVELQGAR